MELAELTELLKKNNKQTGIRKEHLIKLGVYQEVIDKTGFLDQTYALRERIYAVLHGITSVPVCRQCGTPTHLNKANARHGFTAYCSKECHKPNAGKDGAEAMRKLALDPGFKEIHADKIHAGVVKSLGVDNPMHIKEIADKIRKPPKQKQMRDKPYLTESSLCDFLKKVFGKSVTTQVHIKDGSNRYRVDALIEIEEGKFVVEYDGHYHYNETATALRDLNLSNYCRLKGINLIQIPYFIQLSADVCRRLFGEVIYNRYISGNIGDNVYPHGFIDEDCRLPCDFTEYGWTRFFYEIEFFGVEADVLKSVYEKAKHYGSLSRVMGLIDRTPEAGRTHIAKVKFLEGETT